MKVTQRKIECPNERCGNTLWEATYENKEDGSFGPVWKCTNCGLLQARRIVRRLSNRSRALKAYQGLKAAWTETNNALDQLVAAEVVKNGVILVHNSSFNYHLTELLTKSKISNWDIRYHSAEAAKDLQKAKDFIQEKRIA